VKVFSIFFSIISLIAVTTPVFADKKITNQDWFDVTTINGIIDARVGYLSFAPQTNDLDVETVSDIYIFNAGLGAEIEPNEYLSGAIFFLWEEDFGGEDLGVDMDEGFITLAWMGLFGQLGKTYLPVGQFDTFAISDPLVLELAECRQSALGIGYEHIFFHVSGWTFAGDFENVDENGKAADNIVDSYAARLNVMPLAFQDRYSVTIGGYFLSDATETSLEFGGNLAEVDPDNTPDNGDEFIRYKTDVPLYGGFLTAELPFTDLFGIGITGEYVTTGEFNEEEYVDNTGAAAAISAMNGEVAALVLNGAVRIGGKFETISGLDWLETQGNDPNYEVTSFSQYGGFAGYDPWDHLHLGLQVMSGADNRGNKITHALFQTALEF